MYGKRITHSSSISWEENANLAATEAEAAQNPAESATKNPEDDMALAIYTVPEQRK